MGYDIESLKRKMLVKYPFFGTVVTNVNYKEYNEISTAETDGKTIYYNSEFLNGLSVEEQTFIFAHEVCHIAFNHVLRSDGKDSQLWNTATDAVINSFLKRDGLKMVEGGVDMAEAINYDAEQLYEKLLKEKQQQQSQENQNSNRQQNADGLQSENDSSSEVEEKSNSERQLSGESESSFKENDVGHDTHSLWKEAIKEWKKDQSKLEETKEIEEKQEESQKLGEKTAFNKNIEEKKQRLKELKEAILKEASAAGTTTNSDIRVIKDIGYSKPLIDWRRLLRETTQYDVDWSYQNAYIEDGVVRPNLEKQPRSETEIVLDTSGSINEVLLKNFLRECKNILLKSKIKVGCFDTKFYGFHDIHTENDIENMQFVGGGGTDFNVAIDAFTKRVDNKIVFTDGKAKIPDAPMNVIWVVFGNTRINPKGGKVIYIDEKALSKMHLSYDNDYAKIKKL